MAVAVWEAEGWVVLAVAVARVASWEARWEVASKVEAVEAVVRAAAMQVAAADVGGRLPGEPAGMTAAVARVVGGGGAEKWVVVGMVKAVVATVVAVMAVAARATAVVAMVVAARAEWVVVPVVAVAGVAADSTPRRHHDSFGGMNAQATRCRRSCSHMSRLGGSQTPPTPRIPRRD